jgi:hypothetical protein
MPGGFSGAGATETGNDAEIAGSGAMKEETDFHRIESSGPVGNVEQDLRRYCSNDQPQLLSPPDHDTAAMVASTTATIRGITSLTC